MYKTSAQLKKESKEQLRGRWGEALVLNLIPTLLQILVLGIVSLATLIVGLILFHTFSSQAGLSVNGTVSSGSYDSGYNEQTIIFNQFPAAGAFASFLSFGYTSPVVSIIFGYITIGISFTFLDVIRRGSKQPMTFKEAFRLFNGRDFVPILLINVLMYFFTLFWSFLFIIPGIVKKYAYSQSNFIYKDMATHEDPNRMRATNIITESRQLMNGNKGRLFWLDISFIGWYLVGICTFGIAFLWINPYINATKAAFYADLAKEKYLIEEVSKEDEKWTSF